MAGNVDEVKSLLQTGVDVDFEDPGGQTALFWAVMRNDKSAATLLVEHGAIIDKINTTGQTPLMGAALRGHIQMIDLLVSLGAEVNRTDATGLTPWAWAALNKHEEACQELSKNGADNMLHHKFGSESLPLISMAQLSEWNGEGETGKLCIGCLGLVFDVSEGWSFYGPGGGYSAFAGNDATIALGRHVVDKSVIGQRYSSLTLKERIEVENWAAKYKQKYKLIGKLHTLNSDANNSKL
mmetsp:Transcript_3799/g.5102  ORF Transcript_3799/g.5102 Transcript_3799/m.5102 type:complete len:239 (-) Transcript_3799:954-1670(-)